MLCRPPSATGKMPGAIGLCGQLATGKININYRTFCYNLARKRFRGAADRSGRSGRTVSVHPCAECGALQGECCPEHNQSGKMLGLFNETLRPVARDGTQSARIDYLTERPDVDATRLGVTGCSGGGTLSSYLWALDDRLTMAAPSCLSHQFLPEFRQRTAGRRRTDHSGVGGSRF